MTQPVKRGRGRPLGSHNKTNRNLQPILLSKRRHNPPIIDISDGEEADELDMQHLRPSSKSAKHHKKGYYKSALFLTHTTVPPTHPNTHHPSRQEPMSVKDQTYGLHALPPIHPLDASIPSRYTTIPSNYTSHSTSPYPGSLEPLDPHAYPSRIPDALEQGTRTNPYKTAPPTGWYDVPNLTDHLTPSLYSDMTGSRPSMMGTGSVYPSHIDPPETQPYGSVSIEGEVTRNDHTPDAYMRTYTIRSADMNIPQHTLGSNSSSVPLHSHPYSLPSTSYPLEREEPRGPAPTWGKSEPNWSSFPSHGTIPQD